MKEKLENLTPLEMDRMEKGRLSLEDAQEMANMIITKFEGYDLSKLEPEDYEHAMKEIEEIKRWAEANETTREKLIEVLKRCSLFGTLRLISVVGPSVFLGSNTFAKVVSGVLGVAAGYKMWPSLDYRRKNANKELSDLKNETEERLEAEEKFKE